MRLPASRIQSWFKRLLVLENLLLSLLLSGMILLAAGQILLRNGFNSGISWADPALRLAVLWLTMMGAMGAARENHHIQIDLLSRYLPARSKILNQLLTNTFSALICGLLAWHGGRMVLFEWQDGNLLFGVVPAWLGMLILPIGFAVMSARFALRALLCRHSETEH